MPEGATAGPIAGRDAGRDGEPLRILMAVPSFLPEVTGGAEHAVFRLSRALLERGHHVEVLTFHLERRWKVRWRTRTTRFEGLTVHRWGGIHPTRFLERTRLRNVSGRIVGHQIVPRGGLGELLSSFDVVHFNDEVNLSFPLYTLARLRGARVFHVRTLVQRYRLLAGSPASRWILRRAADVFLVDADGYEERLRDLGIGPDRIRRLRKGVNLERFRPPQPESPRQPLLLFVGRLDDRLKGADVLLDALERSSFRGAVHLFGGTFEETDYVQRLRRRAGTLAGRVQVTVHGFTPQDELRRWYGRATALVHPARLDSLPNAVLEAMASATPVIASRTGGLTELTEGDRAAVGVPPEDPQALAAALDRLHASPERRADLGRQARRLVETRFSMEQYVSGIVDLYRSLPRRPASRRAA